MSIKNQSRFTIFASLIVGATILAFVALNLIVDKISKINTSQVAQQEPRGPRLRGGAGGLNSGADDEYKPGQAGQPHADALPPGSKAGPDMPGAPAPMRRMNGKNGAEFEQKPAQQAAQKPSSVPAQQPDPRQGPPPGYPGGGYPDPSRMSPEQREAFEEELYRRQQLMQQHEYDYPPPEFYQGPGPYDRGYEDDYDYYDPGYRGQKTDAKSSQVKLSDSSPNPDYDEEEDEEYEPDDYLEEDLE